jgi:histidinol phosphatase-like PHP family hydrolase
MSIDDMALAAKEKFGLHYIAITDHTTSLKLTNGLDENQLLDQANKIPEINDRIKQGQSSIKRHASNNNTFKILSGAEVNIMNYGMSQIM